MAIMSGRIPPAKEMHLARPDIAAQVAARMKLARKELGLSLRAAARLLHFNNYQVLASIEKGAREVTTSELVDFARAYGRELSFFLALGRPAAAPDVRWRNRAGTVTTKLAEQRFRNFLEAYARLEELSGRRVGGFSLGSDHEVLSWEDVARLGGEISRQMELCGRPALELRAVLEEKCGVKLLVAAMGSAGSAASATGDFGAGILVNAMDAPWRISYDLAHELFHLLTWQQESQHRDAEAESGKPLRERYADGFASELLLPEGSVGPEFRGRLKNGRISFLNCVELARAFGVSTEALLWRLVRLGLLKKASVEKALANDNLKKVDKAARVGDWANHPGTKPSRRFVTVAFECLKLGMVSRGRFAELMGIPRSEIAVFLAEYGYDEAEDYVGEISAP